MQKVLVLLRENRLSARNEKDATYNLQYLQYAALRDTVIYTVDTGPPTPTHHELTS